VTAPRDLHDVAAARLVGGGALGLDAVIGGGVPLSRDRKDTFMLRLDHHYDDLVGALEIIHPDDEVRDALVVRLVELAATAFAERPDELHRLDAQRLLRPDWLQQPRMFGYACYTERFADDLRGISKRLDHLEELGVTYLHLMPLLQPREGDNDGGYAVQDYRAVRSDLGTMDDLRDLATTLRERGISLCMDLVLNHVSIVQYFGGMSFAV
jgi:amylosucrase